MQWEEPDTSGSKHRKAWGSPTDHCKGQRSWTVRGLGSQSKCRCRGGKISFYFPGIYLRLFFIAILPLIFNLVYLFTRLSKLDETSA